MIASHSSLQVNISEHLSPFFAPFLLRIIEQDADKHNDRSDDCLGSVDVNEAGLITYNILEIELPNDYEFPPIELTDDDDSNIGGREVSHGLAAIPTPKAS